MSRFEFTALFGLFQLPCRTVFRRVCPPGNSILGETGYNSAIEISSIRVCACRTPLSEDLKMKKLVLALTALAAFTRIGSRGRPSCPRLYQGSGGDAGRSELDRLLHLRRRWRRRLGCEQHGVSSHCDGRLPLCASISARVATAGSAPSVPVTTGSSTAAGSSASSLTASSAASGASINDPLRGSDRHRKAAGHLGGWRARRLSGGAECALLRQRRLHRLALVGHDTVQPRSAALPAGVHTGSLQRAMACSSAAASRTT